MLQDRVSELRASDGTVLGNFRIGYQPIDLAFDGTRIWATLQHGDRVGRLRASDGAHLPSFRVEDVPVGILFDSSSIWVANNASDSVTKISP